MLSPHPWIQALAAFGILLLVAFAANFITRKLILRMLTRALALTPFGGEPRALAEVTRRLANIVPALVVHAGIGSIPHIAPGAVVLVRNVTTAFMILTVALAIGAALNAVNDIYQRRPDAAMRPIKGYVQVVKIVIFCAAAILMIAALIDQSPLILLSGLGALAAVLMLVFKDTILSLVASVQLTSNDMLRVGDWIEMPKLDADGDVIDIALHTVKVQNWDKTITTIPTHRLISESFKNWRGMSESGGRRIKRSLLIDQNSVGFLSEGQLERLNRFSLIREYLDAKQAELKRWNEADPARVSDPVNARRITNVGTFRAYVAAYLRNHPRISREMTSMVRQLQPTATGLPLEIYCFTSTTAWVEYEGIQADIFDHLLAIMSEFGLRLFQQPSGRDLVDAFIRNAGDLAAPAKA